MGSAIPYTPRNDDLLSPCNDVPFFQGGPPASEALLCAEFSRLAYCPEARTRTELSPVGFDLLKFFNKKDAQADTQAFLARNPAVAVLAFRGTQPTSIQDLLTDAKVKLMPWAGAGRVHAGFAYALSIVWPEIESAMKSLCCPVLFTGHSLGAALATLAGALHRPRAIFTFGSPRVGDGDFARSLEGVEISRYVDCADLIARLPAPWYLSLFPPGILKYVHVGRLLYTNQHGAVAVDPAPKQIKQDQWAARKDYALKYLKPGNALVRDLADHAPLNYVSALAGRA